jgi:hypothetical protein
VEIVSDSEQQQAGGPGDTVAYTLEIENIGPEPDSFTIAVSGSTWNTQASQSSITLEPDERAAIEVMVEIPAEAGIADSDTATITVSSQADDTQTSSSTLSTTVYAITLAPQTSMVDPGQIAAYTLTIENPGTLTETFVIEAADFGWSTSITATDATTMSNPVPNGSTALMQTAALTATLESGERARFAVLVAVPAAVQAGATDEATLRVWLANRPDEWRSFVIETGITQSSGALYLPLVLGGE